MTSWIFVGVSDIEQFCSQNLEEEEDQSLKLALGQPWV